MRKNVDAALAAHMCVSSLADDRRAQQLYADGRKTMSAIFTIPTSSSPRILRRCAGIRDDVAHYVRVMERAGLAEPYVDAPNSSRNGTRCGRFLRRLLGLVRFYSII